MQGNKLVVSRVITTNRLNAPRSIDERVREFVESNTTISLYPFSADFSVKAARPASADNKERRKKSAGKNKRYGMGLFDPEATMKPGQFLYPYPRYFNRDGLSGDKPNIGWLDPLRTIKPSEMASSFKTLVALTKNEPKAIVRIGKKNPRTGTIEAKALGRSIGSMGRSIGQAAARAIGIVIDANGRFRCPPGVPAANQFTDDTGSNCFDFTPDVGKNALLAIQNRLVQIRSQIQDIDNAVPVFRDDDGKMRLGSGRGGIIGPDGSSTDGDKLPQTILGPDGSAITHIYPELSPDEYGDEVRRVIREIYPDMPDEKVEEYVRTAKQRASMYDATRDNINTALDYMSELGIQYNQDSAASMQIALASTLFALKEDGWDLDLSNFFQLSEEFTGNEGQVTDRNIQDALRRHNESIMMGIFAIVAERYRIGEEGFDEAEKFVNWYDRRLKNNPRYDGDLSARILTAIQNGDSPSVFTDEIERNIYERAAIMFRQYQSTEIGFMVGLVAQHRTDKNLAEQVKELAIASPFDSSGMVDYDSLRWNAQADVTDKGIRLVWNPLGMIATQPPTSLSTGPFRLFEASNSGTEVAKIRAISEAVSETSRRELLDQYLGEIRSVANDLTEIRAGEEYNEDFIRKNFGRVAQGMFINWHEYTHVEQLSKVAYSLTHSVKGKDMRTMTNAQALEMAMEILSGKNDFLTLGDIMQDGQVWKEAIDRLPEISNVLLQGNFAGRYIRDEYYKAAILQDIVSQPDVPSRYAKVKEYHDIMSANEASGFGQTAYSAALKSVFSQYLYSQDDGYVDLSDEAIVAAFKRHSALTLTEMQAELSASVKMGLVERTPEVDAILAPLETARIIPSQKMRDDFPEQGSKKRIKYTLRGIVSKPRESDAGDFNYVTDSEYDDRVTSETLSDTVRFSNRTSASRWGINKRNEVLSTATPEQRLIAESQWRNAPWAEMPSDYRSMSMLLASTDGPRALDEVIDSQIYPFAQLIEASQLEESIAVEMRMPPNTIGRLGDDLSGRSISVDAYFTGAIKTDADIEPSQPLEPRKYERLIVKVPVGMSGFPDYTPGTQRGEVGALVLPPSTIEVVGRRTDGTIMAKVRSQKSPNQSIAPMESALEEIANSESAPLALRVDANKALRKIKARKSEIEEAGPRRDSLRSQRTDIETAIRPIRYPENSPLPEMSSLGETPPRISRRERRRLERITQENSRTPERNTGQKISGGPQNLTFGLDEMGVPVVGSIEQLEQRFGNTPSAHRSYFKEVHGIDVRPSMPQGIVGENAYYATLQALDEIFANTDLKKSLKNQKLKIRIGEDDAFGAYGEVSIPQNWIFRYGKGKINAGISLRRIASESELIRNELVANRGRKLAQGLMFENTMGMSIRAAEVSDTIARGGPDVLSGEAAKRFAYAVAVHEMAHMLDHLARKNAGRRSAVGTWLFSGPQAVTEESASLQFLSAGEKEVIDKLPSVSRYGSNNVMEKMAEAFTAWWLFSRYQGSALNSIVPAFRDEGGVTRSAEPASLSRIYTPIIQPLMESLGARIKSDEQTMSNIPPLVGLYAALPFIIIEEDSK